MGWKNRPTTLHEIEKDIEYVLFVDESGTAEMKTVHRRKTKDEEVKDDEKYFTLTGVLIHRNEIPKISKKITQLKEKYWPPHGTATYKSREKRVCFHSYEIRKRKGPFGSNVLDNYNDFIGELSLFLKELEVKVFSVVIDKEKHYMKYHSPIPPYSLGMSFMLERVQHFVEDAPTTVVVEARGKEEDRILLNQMVSTLETGTYYVSSEKLTAIKGIYFNGKWNSEEKMSKSFFGLEIADLFCHPIGAYARTQKKTRPFEVVESKLYGYPFYEGKGYKIFPR